jgi:hypothetical protein
MLSKFNHTQQLRQSITTGGFVYVFLLLFPVLSSAQTAKIPAALAKDERERYIYYELVEKSAIPVDSLVSRAGKFLGFKKLDSIKAQNGALHAAGKMVLNKTAFVLTHPSAEVGYSFTLEYKDDKYRFWLTDFIIIPYKRDRYSNFVPATVKGTPLENNPGKLNAAEWASYVDAVAKQAAFFAEELKNCLTAVQKNKPPKVLQKNNW